MNSLLRRAFIGIGLFTCVHSGEKATSEEKWPFCHSIRIAYRHLTHLSALVDGAFSATLLLVVFVEGRHQSFGG